MIEHRQYISDPKGATAGLNLQWLAGIICHLRDDLAKKPAAHPLPQNAEILTWVEETYYPGLHELTWEEAVLSLLSRMQHSRTSAPRRSPKADFANEAMTQLRRATGNSYIWQV